ncbi:MAG TPA: diacylglycerol kinase family protein [Afifellaceae bacterium]|nr:diacylglycerol kinase family protein [Afifellaceae bacterium]
MKLTLVVNCTAGTLRGLDAEEIAGELAGIFERGGHEVRVTLTEGSGCIATLESVFAASDGEAVVVGGGDGTISAAAALAARHDVALGIIPLGTMNLFARSLGVPLEMYDAAEALAAGEVGRVDIGEANGRYFVHHVTVGLHAQMIEMRERLAYNSRIGKVLANLQAFLSAVQRPRFMRAIVTVDNAIFRRRTAAILVATNPLGEGHLPYADDPRQGRLAVYISRSDTTVDLLELAAEVTLGDINGNPLLESHEGERVTIALPRRRRVRASLDGEIVALHTPLEARIRPGGLKVIRPAVATGG